MKHFLALFLLALTLSACSKKEDAQASTEFRDALIGKYNCELRHQETQFYANSIGYQNFYYDDILVNVSKGTAKDEIVIDHNNIGAVQIDSTTLDKESFRISVAFDTALQSLTVVFNQNDTNGYVYQGVKVE